MFYRGEGVIKVVQQPFPFLVLGRLPKANRVIFERLPAHQQQVLILHFQTAVQFM